MNERIKELYDEIPKAEWTIDRLASIEKFAQLIVREVLSKIDDEGFEVYKPVAEAVQKHFGVE